MLSSRPPQTLLTPCSILQTTYSWEQKTTSSALWITSTHLPSESPGLRTVVRCQRGCRSANIFLTDQTFHMFSTLKFTPGEWDIYSCTVVHSALEEPKTKTWGDYLVFYLEFLWSCCVVWVMTSFLCNVFHRTRLLWREPWSRCFLWAGPDSGLAGRHSCSFSDCQSTTQAVIHSVQQREMYYLIFIMSDLHSEINLLPCVLCK